MKQRRLGSTDIQVSEVGYGAMHLSIDRDMRPAEADAIALIQRAVDELGITFIDTADAYCADDTETGHNERLIAKALAGGRRSRVTVATKGGSVRPEGRWERDGRPQHLRAACEASLRALDVEIIDLYQLHAPDPYVPVEESVGTLADLQREGKIRHVGVSNFSVDQIERAGREATIVSVQNQFSVINRKGEQRVIDYCEKNGLTYIPWNPIGGRGKAQTLGSESALSEIAAAHGVVPHAVAIAWLLQLSPVMLPIPGTRSFDHLKADLAGADLTLSPEEMEKLEEN